MKSFKYLPVLSIAGSDCGGGAGIQADLKTFAALGCYGTSVISAVTAQNTLGISAVHPIPSEIVKQQIIAVMDDIQPLAIKIGMLYSAEIVIAVAETLKNYPNIPIIFDPVMSASSGDSLMQKDTLKAFQAHLFPIIILLTPNLNEATQLTQQAVKNLEDMKNVASKLLKLGLKNVLIKGGHLHGEQLINFYQNQEGHQHQFISEKINSQNLHGTGCTLSSAIAVYLAQGFSLLAAVERSGNYVHQSILQGANVKVGSGNGPLNHFFEPQKLIKMI
ncbi:bifunctional hydroxymethylpyrimidine kinase/phosphomethylpyrimidine kinase [Pedobacter alpinus]|uniref:hydroxymethylpyrimidine kinase n=1 Tax=Pedobacter alpinus TaxID=1590643 RepID=A0ABW5TTP9_9SPHI